MLAIFVRRMSSRGVRPVGRSVRRRVNSTSVGICRRELVRWKIFSGEKTGRALRRKESEVMSRMSNARTTLGGIGRMETPCTEGAERTER